MELITSNEHPRLRSAMARLKRAGVLDNPLPGTFVLAADASERAWLRASGCRASRGRRQSSRTRPAELREALQAMTGSVGQAVRRCVVEACLANPWSYAELRLHRILRQAGISGWVANVKIRLGGEVIHPDVLFAEAKVVIEFDGRAAHDDPAQFLRDRERQNTLVAHGYVVLRFGWEHLDQPEYIVSLVRHALRTAGRIR